MKKSGIHIIANFYNCKNAGLLIDKSLLSELMIKSIEENSMNILDSSFHKFDEGGITGYVLLSESHVAIHTWPERDNYLTLDIFVCNYGKDNTESARKIYAELKEKFLPGKTDENFIERD